MIPAPMGAGQQLELFFSSVPTMNQKSDRKFLTAPIPPDFFQSVRAWGEPWEFP